MQHGPIHGRTSRSKTCARRCLRHPYRLTGAFSDVAPEGTAAKMAYAGRPSTLVIDKQGRIRKVLVGLHDPAEFEAALRSAR